jgi:hypothetical protein
MAEKSAELCPDCGQVAGRVVGYKCFWDDKGRGPAPSDIAAVLLRCEHYRCSTCHAMFVGYEEIFRPPPIARRT